MDNIEIRPASKGDIETIHRFITDLATYEKMESEVKATVSDIEASLFSPQSTAHAIICEFKGEPIGFAVYFFNYSTWLGKSGLYLEDLYVSPEYRGIGGGKEILKYLANLALEANGGRFEWCVLDWNEPAIDFYKSIGPRPLDGWSIYRLAGDELVDFAR